MAMPTARSGLLRANLTVASGTALSRLTGLVRIIVFGVVVGQTALADAYDIANNAPNVVYELLLGGILAATLVPLFTRHLQKGDDESVSAITSFAFVALGVITALAIALTPLIFRAQFSHDCCFCKYFSMASLQFVLRSCMRTKSFLLLLGHPS